MGLKSGPKLEIGGLRGALSSSIGLLLVVVLGLLLSFTLVFIGLGRLKSGNISPSSGIISPKINGIPRTSKFGRTNLLVTGMAGRTIRGGICGLPVLCGTLAGSLGLLGLLAIGIGC